MNSCMTFNVTLFTLSIYANMHVLIYIHGYIDSINIIHEVIQAISETIVLLGSLS